MQNVTRALVGAIVASFVAVAVSVYAQTPTAADFGACNTEGRAAMKGGHHRSAHRELRARGVSPDGQRSGVDHVGRADAHGVLGSPAYGDGDR